MRMFRKTIPVLLLALGLASCDQARPPTSPSRVSPVPSVAQRPVVNQFRGTVHDTAGRPLAGAGIGAWSGPEAYATSDANGEFTITCCNLGAFVGTDIFSARKEGYTSETRTLSAGLHFVLAPIAVSASRDRSSH